MGGISADDDRAVEKLEAKLAGLEAMQEEMKTVNAYYRKHKTLDGCPVLSAEEIGKLQSSMASDWRKIPYPIRPICLPTTTPTSAAHASALRI